MIIVTLWWYRGRSSVAVKLSQSIIFTRIAQEINIPEFYSEVQVNDGKEHKDNKSKKWPIVDKSCIERAGLINTRSLTLEIIT